MLLSLCLIICSWFYLACQSRTNKWALTRRACTFLCVSRVSSFRTRACHCLPCTNALRFKYHHSSQSTLLFKPVTNWRRRKKKNNKKAQTELWASAAIVPLCSTIKGEAVFRCRGVETHCVSPDSHQMNFSLLPTLPPSLLDDQSLFLPRSISNRAVGRKWSMVTMVTASGRRPAASSCWSVFTGIRPPVCTILIVGGGGGYSHTGCCLFWGYISFTLWFFLNCPSIARPPPASSPPLTKQDADLPLGAMAPPPTV